MFLNIGQEVQFIDLLRGILIQSGNDASVVLAEGLLGSEEAFAYEMTKLAKSFGATDTNFINVTGLPDGNHYTTPYDLYLMSIKTIYDFPDFYKIYSEKYYTYNKIKQGNRNPLLYTKTGCDGIKTGSSNVGGYGMVASCVQDERRLILVINGLASKKQRSIESIKLINYGFNFFKNYKLFKKDQVIDKLNVWYGNHDKISVATTKDVSITIPKTCIDSIIVKLVVNSSLKAPIKKGDYIGHLAIESKCLLKPQKVDLIALDNIETCGFFSRIKDSIAYMIFGEKF